MVNLFFSSGSCVHTYTHQEKKMAAVNNAKTTIAAEGTEGKAGSGRQHDPRHGLVSACIRARAQDEILAMEEAARKANEWRATIINWSAVPKQPASAPSAFAWGGTTATDTSTKKINWNTTVDKDLLRSETGVHIRPVTTNCHCPTNGLVAAVDAANAAAAAADGYDVDADVDNNDSGIESGNSSQAKYPTLESVVRDVPNKTSGDKNDADETEEPVYHPLAGVQQQRTHSMRFCAFTTPPPACPIKAKAKAKVVATKEAKPTKNGGNVAAAYADIAARMLRRADVSPEVSTAAVAEMDTPTREEVLRMATLAHTMAMTLITVDNDACRSLGMLLLQDVMALNVVAASLK